VARRATVRFLIGNLTYVAAIAVAFVSAEAALAIAGLNAVYYTFERTPAVPVDDESETELTV
jgi:hypothetical protein